MPVASVAVDTIWFVACLALATTSISFTLTKTPVFDWVRDRLDGMLYDLWSCPYCMSHWVAGFFVAVFQPKPFTGTWIDFLPVIFIIVTVSGLIIQFIMLMSETLSYLKRNGKP